MPPPGHPSADVELVEIDGFQGDPGKLDRYVAWLSPDERSAYDARPTDALRLEYLATRALSRLTLSEHVPLVHPAEWRFGRTEEGRPYVVAPRPAPSFNLSNTDVVVACALSRTAVGIDVEPETAAPLLLERAARIFSEAENGALARLAADARARAAIEVWTLKEAYLKARGEGITRRLGRFTVLREPGRISGSYRLDPRDVEDATDWHLAVSWRQARASGTRYAIAVAVLRPGSIIPPVAVRDRTASFFGIEVDALR